MTDYALPPTPDGVDEFAWRAAISAIRGYCGWHIAPSVTEVVTVDGPGRGMLQLPTLHLTAVTSVTNDSEVVDLTSTEFQWNERGALRQRCNYWTYAWRGVTAEITHGYEDFPQDVLAVARDMAKAADRVGASAYTSGPHQVQFGVTGAGTQAGAVGMSDLQKLVLDRFALPKRP
jgi:hypothetical protein